MIFLLTIPQLSFSSENIEKLASQCQKKVTKACNKVSVILYEQNKKGDALEVAGYSCNLGNLEGCKMKNFMLEEKMAYQQEQQFRMLQMQNQQLQFQQQQQALHQQQQAMEQHNNSQRQLINMAQDYVDNLTAPAPANPKRRSISCQTRYNSHFNTATTDCSDD